jgi:hypothetical protein
MRGSDFYQKQIDAINAIASAPESNWQAKIEYVVRRLHSEATPLARTTFRQLKEDICRELETLAQMRPAGHEVFSFAATLIKKL